MAALTTLSGPIAQKNLLALMDEYYMHVIQQQRSGFVCAWTNKRELYLGVEGRTAWCCTDAGSFLLRSSICRLTKCYTPPRGLLARTHPSECGARVCVFGCKIMRRQEESCCLSGHGRRFLWSVCMEATSCFSWACHIAQIVTRRLGETERERTSERRGKETKRRVLFSLPSLSHTHTHIWSKQYVLTYSLFFGTGYPFKP